LAGVLELAEGEPAESLGHVGEGKRERNHPAPVDRRRERFPRARSLRDERRNLLLQRMVRQPVPLAGPAARGADRQHARVLAGTVVPEAAAFHWAALEIVLARPGARQQELHGLELLGRRPMRGARDRDLLVGEILVDAD
jgi:hypothetical protein